MLKSTLAAVAAVFALSALSPAALAAKGDPHVLLTTSAGNIELELNSQKAPVSVKTLSITSTVVSITTLRFTALFLAL
ncbi:peptidyl-prolyl cis-trans isomerase [Salmonella enterica subsp. enterica]|uniref:Peptidyl-prolyl cis-trans isomerase n=1 Tax=Salmonella enterica I TaxID=59201 RepID=A0A447PW19_SALET|nr:peptidyl-prolyl cis-trans isomerase [Salmonella enterica subsp. enterica]